VFGLNILKRQLETSYFTTTFRMKVAICIKLKMLEVGDSADNKSDSIPIDLKEFRFDSIRFTGCVVVARGQVMVLGGGGSCES